MPKGFLVTIEELEQNPWKLEAKLRNLDNIAIWKNYYHNKRIHNGIKVKPWRTKIEQLEKEIKQSQREIKATTKRLKQMRERQIREDEQFNKFHERLIQFHHSLIDKRARLIERQIQLGTQEYETFLSIAARSFGNDIHDFTEVKTGLVTFRCFCSNEKTPTSEHFWPRSSIGGRDIFEQAVMMGEKFNIRHTIKTLFQLCQTVDALDSENRDLIKYQKNDTFVDPNTAYKNADIQLVRVKPFTLHTNWERVFDIYKIENIKPYEFDDVMTIEEATEERKNINLIWVNSLK